MTFEVAAQAYDRFMGRWSTLLAEPFASLAGVTARDRVVDVGCGPGALTAVLADRCGADAVAAVDPSEPFVDAVRERLPGVDARVASADVLPFGDGTFDVALAQLVVHFLPDPVAGVAEVARVTRAAGRVAASVWDFGSGRAPLSVFWRAVRELDPAAQDESGMPGVHEGQLADVFRSAGLVDVVAGELTVHHGFADLDAWWEPFTLGVGPAGAYVAGLDPAGRSTLRERCGQLLPPLPGVLSATAWTAVGVVAGRPSHRAGDDPAVR